MAVLCMENEINLQVVSSVEIIEALKGRPKQQWLQLQYFSDNPFPIMYLAISGDAAWAYIIPCEGHSGYTSLAFNYLEGGAAGEIDFISDDGALITRASDSVITLVDALSVVDDFIKYGVTSWSINWWDTAHQRVVPFGKKVESR